MADYANPAVLVPVDWLADRLGDPRLRIVEVDEDTSAYASAHIPGAVAWNWFRDLHQRPRREYLDQAGMAHLLGRCGVGPDTTVVLYGGNNNWFAAYAYWLLQYLGVDGVRLLNGGRKRWELEQRPLTTDVPEYSPTEFAIANPVRVGLRVLRDQLLAQPGESALVDVRSPEEFRGEMIAPAHLPQESAMVPGHIPGAHNVPWSRVANEDGTFKDVDQLRDLYRGAGIHPDRSVIAYCRIGERSAHTWFVLHELLGYPDVANYDGSWTEYGSLVGVPVEL